MTRCPYCHAAHELADAERQLLQTAAALAQNLLRFVDINRRAMAVQTQALDDLHTGLSAIVRSGTRPDDGTPTAAPSRVQ